MSCNLNNAADDEDSSSSLLPSSTTTLESVQTLPNDIRSALDEFRDIWQREIKGQSGNGTPVRGGSPCQTKNDGDILSPLINGEAKSDAEKQILAETLFRKGVELELRGKVYDALPFYRKAVQIVPDIEFKFYEQQNGKLSTNADANSANPIRPLNNCEDCVPEQLAEDLYEKFQLELASNGGKLLFSNRDGSVITTEMHISDLPPEIILYILRWVVSAQLDMRSLEQCAAVSKGMYLCARDEEIWRLACLKVWGENVGTPNNPVGESDEILSADHTLPTYNSWRHMFIERERVLYSGCYISKTTYLRMGENSFQDQFYRPVQLVEYYRYIRFLPDGTILMMTNADEPNVGVTKLKNLHQLRPDVLRGTYRVYGNTVTIMLKKQQQQRLIHTVQQYGRQKRGNSAFPDDLNSTQYCIEFRIVHTNKRKFAQLVWQSYSIIQTRNKVETSSEFDLTASKYPPLWFSPVRSYHLISDSPLS